MSHLHNKRKSVFEECGSPKKSSQLQSQQSNDEEDISQPSESEEDSSQSSDNKGECSQSSISEEECSQSSDSEVDDAHLSVNEENGLQPSVSEENCSMLSVTDQNCSQSSSNEEDYSQSSNSEEDHSLSSDGEDDGSQPAASGIHYSLEDYLQSSVSDVSQSSVSEKDSSQSSDNEKDCSSSPVMKSADIKKEMERVQEIAPSIAAYLPELVLKLIFSFLAFDDLINVQKVCTSWNLATMDTLVWRSAPLSGENGIMNKLGNVQHLHTVTGCITHGDKLLDALINYVFDLRKFDCEVCDTFSAVKFRNFVLKFKNLEFVRLNNIIPEFIESLYILGTYSKLKHIRILYDHSLENQVCQVIGNGFFALRKLDIRCDFHEYMPQYEDSNSALSDLLKKKVNQLTDLCFNNDVNREAFELISKSTILKELRFDINNWQEISLDFSMMIGLKKLILQVRHGFPEHSRGSYLEHVYKNMVFPQNTEYLEIEFRHKTNFSTGVVRNIIDSAPNLVVLSVENDDSDIDQQLQNINKLVHLQVVNFRFCYSLTSVGVEHILRCIELRKLDLSKVTFTDTTFKQLKNCKNLENLKLYYCVLHSDQLLSTILALKNLELVYMYFCRHVDPIQGRLVPFNIDFIKYIKQELRRNEHQAIINCQPFIY